MTQQTTLTIAGEEIAKLLTDWARDHGYNVDPKTWVMEAGHVGKPYHYSATTALPPQNIDPVPLEVPGTRG